MKKKALVIGSEGNIGKPLMKHLSRCGYEVLAVDIQPAWREQYYLADINNPVDLLPAFDWGPDVVFLLSAMVSRVTCEQAAGLAISTNLAGINNVLQLCKRAKSRTVFFSTSEVYGPECDPMDERLSDPKPNNRYGLSKLLGEKLVEYEVQYGGLQAITLRPFMMYDELEDLGDHRSAMIRFATNLAQGKPIEVHKGSARGWLHVSDAVAAIEAAAQVDDYSIVNIGEGNIVPIENLAKLICRELDADPSLITYRDLPEQMTLVKNPTLERMRDVLGVETKVSLEEGVKKVCTEIRRRIASNNAV